jgi:endo-1,4-beta-D-glucanase Y
MLKLPQTRLRLLAKRLIPDKKMDDDEDNEEKEKLQKENILKDAKRMSIMIGKTADAEKQRDLMNKAIEKVALEKKKYSEKWKKY